MASEGTRGGACFGCYGFLPVGCGAALPGWVTSPFALPVWTDRPSNDAPVLNRERLMVDITDDMCPGLENDLTSFDRTLDRSINHHLIG